MTTRIGGPLLYLTFDKMPWWVAQASMMSLMFRAVIGNMMRAWLTSVREERTAASGMCLRRGHAIYLSTLAVAGRDGAVRFGDLHTGAKVSLPHIPEVFGVGVLRPLFDARFGVRQRITALREASSILNDANHHVYFNWRTVIKGDPEVIRFLTGPDERELYVLSDWLQDRGVAVSDAVRGHAKTNNRAAAATEIAAAEIAVAELLYEREHQYQET